MKRADGILFAECRGEPLFFETLLCLSEKFSVYAYESPVIIVTDWKKALSLGDMFSLRNPFVIADADSVRKSGGFVNFPTARGYFRLTLCELGSMEISGSLSADIAKAKSVYAKVMRGEIPPPRKPTFPLYVSGGFTTFELDLFSLNGSVARKGTWEIFVRKNMEIVNEERYRIYRY